jgi:hypothetical protein
VFEEMKPKALAAAVKQAQQQPDPDTPPKTNISTHRVP